MSPARHLAAVLCCLWWTGTALATPTFKVVSQPRTGELVIGGGSDLGLAPGYVLVIHDGQRTLGWVTLTDVGRATSRANITFEEVPGAMGPGQMATFGPKPTAPPTDPASPEGLREQRHAPANTMAPTRPGSTPLQHLRATAMDQPGNPLPSLDLGRAYLDLGDPQEAIHWLKAAVRADQNGPHVAQALALLADAYALTGNQRLAEKYQHYLAGHYPAPDAITRATPTRLTAPATTPDATPPARSSAMTEPATPLPGMPPPLQKAALANDPFEDPFSQPLPPPEEHREGDGFFMLHQLTGEGHSGGDDEDDFLYGVYAIGTTMGPAMATSLLVMDRYNLSRSGNDAVIVGLNLTNSPTPNWTLYGTAVVTDYNKGARDPGADDETSRLSVGARRRLTGNNHGALSAQAVFTQPIDGGDTTWDGALQWRTRLDGRSTGQIGYQYTYNQSLSDDFLQQFQLLYNRKLGQKEQLALEYLLVDPLFEVDPTSPRPRSDNVYRLSWTRVY